MIYWGRQVHPGSGAIAQLQRLSALLPVRMAGDQRVWADGGLNYPTISSATIPTFSSKFRGGEIKQYGIFRPAHRHRAESELWTAHSPAW